MTLRVLYVSEGSSDQGLRPHIERVAVEEGHEILLTAPDFARLADHVGCAVADKLRAAQRLGGEYDLVVVQRDADNQGALTRRDEIAEAVASVWPGLGHVPVVPVRALEAWLLVDEELIRQVAGNPKSKADLGLPRGSAVERIADPKQCLKDALAVARDLKGRRLAVFQQRFARNRHRLLELIDPDGPLGSIPSWQAFVEDMRLAVTAAGGAR